LLVPKARTALTRYGHQAVIGNELHKRKYEVVLVENEDMEASTRSGSTDALELSERFKQTWLRLSDLEDIKKSQGKRDDEIGHLEIEELIVAELVKRHETWIAGG
jgi:phosphopantothenate-cysteine ligase